MNNRQAAAPELKTQRQIFIRFLFGVESLNRHKFNSHKISRKIDEARTESRQRTWHKLDGFYANEMQFSFTVSQEKLVVVQMSRCCK